MMIALNRVVTAMGVVAAFLCGASLGLAEEKYPNRPIEVVVPWGPGGGADQLARKLANFMEPIIGVSMPVVNAPGATGQTGLMKLLTQPGDGYQIQIMTADTFVLFGTGSSNIKTSEFLPVAIMMQQPSGFFVKQNAPWKTWTDLEKAAKAKALKVAVTGFGSPDDITVAYLASKGVNIVSVPYAKPGERYASILGGHTDILFEQAGDIRNFIETKQMRPILLFAEKRFPGFPDIPVSKELAYDVALPQFRAVVIKADTDQKHLKVISDALGKAVASASYKDYLKEQLAEDNSYVPAKDAQKYMDEWMRDAKRVIAAMGKK